MTTEKDWTDEMLTDTRNLRRAVFEMRDYGTKSQADVLGAVLHFIDGKQPSWTLFEDVGHFHTKMELPYYRDGKPKHLTPVEFNFRTAAMFEELREFIEAYALRDIPGQADALADLVYFALGTAHYLRIPFDQIWKSIQAANMLKRRWQPGDPVKPRVTTGMDVVKPVGFKAPDVYAIIADYVEHNFNKEEG